MEQKADQAIHLHLKDYGFRVTEEKITMVALSDQARRKIQNDGTILSGVHLANHHK